LFTFIDLFAGIGGTRLAFESTGCRCVFSSEIDKYAQRTYFANFGETPAGDIGQVKECDIPDHDILLAGFPCQPFSISGVSKLKSLNRPHGFRDQAKGTLFFEIARILEAKRPRAFLLENVKHLCYHDKGWTYSVIKHTLRKELGYEVYDKVIDAQSVVPQHRERIFIVGFRQPTHFEFPEFDCLRPRLKDILEPIVDSKYTLTDHLWKYLKEYALKHREKGNGFGYSLANPDGATRTLSARYYKDGSEILIAQEGRRNPRRLTPRECARLMGFPETFKIPVSDTQAYKQFGNSVVVPVVRRIAEVMIGCMNEGKSPPTESL
jgi:DNA (cytosine-5)-methyltransferase 1